MTVGRFTYQDNGTIVGPADFMEAEGREILRSIANRTAGEALRRIILGTVEFEGNAHLAHEDRIILGILIYLQTKYAGFAGMRDFNNGIAIAAGRA